jgi:hypothetical protein
MTPITAEALQRALGTAGLAVLDLRAGYSKIRQNHAPGTPEYLHAEGAITALDILADRCALALTAPHRRPATIEGGRS